MSHMKSITVLIAAVGPILAGCGHLRLPIDAPPSAADHFPGWWYRQGGWAEYDWEAARYEHRPNEREILRQLRPQIDEALRNAPCRNLPR